MKASVSGSSAGTVGSAADPLSVRLPNHVSARSVLSQWTWPGRSWRSDRPVDVEDCASQHVEADRSDVEHPAVEGLEVERRALSGTGLVAQLQPVPLTDLVRGRLPGPAEVAVELIAQDSFGHAGVRREELPSLAMVPPAPADRCRRGQVTVDANIEHHPSRPQRLLVKRTETVGR